MSKQRIVIVGGGVIGLSIADHCRLKGHSVVLLDRGPFAREASWAGAGFLDLRSAARVGGEFFSLCRSSYDLFPEWTARLKKESGTDPELIHSGSLDVAFNDAEEAALQKMENNLRAFHLQGERWSPAEVRKREPALSAEARSILFFAKTSQVRPPRLTRALVQSLQKGGAILREVEPVERFLTQGRKVTGVKTSQGILEGDSIVLAAGAWSGGLLREAGKDLVQKPFRGQVVMYRAQPGTLKHILFTGVEKGFTYMVPRADGHIYVGSTLEDAGFEKTTTPEGLTKLKTGAHKLVPGLSQQWIEDTWAGLRPGSLDGWPYLGRVPGFDNLWAATGHFTHGLLFSAVTGRLMAQALSGERTDLDLSPYALDREPHPVAGL
ncbi:MAG TPA: glycine oxidase ThiO [bacterium]|nr:glycine oxidase ThiO [bacterium]